MACSRLLQHVFLNITPPPFLSQSSCVPGGVTEHSSQLQAVQEAHVLCPKTCFDRLCHIWWDIYSYNHSFLQQHDTILMTGSICTPCRSKTYFAQMKAKTKTKKKVICMSYTLESGAFGAAKRPEQSYL